MTRIFDMITWAPEHNRAQSYEINNQYFTVDTAEPEDVYDWVNHNRLMVTYALHNDIVQGFFNLMPLTSEAGQQFESNAIKEEDLTIDHIMPPQYLDYCEYVYFPAIAVRDYQTYAARQCTAALMSALATHIRTMYNPKKLKKIFVNPTTFQGNRMVRKLGLLPLRGYKKPLTGNDLYATEFTTELYDRLRHVEDRFSRFVGKNCWIDQEEWRAKLADKLAAEK